MRVLLLGHFVHLIPLSPLPPPHYSEVSFRPSEASFRPHHYQEY